MSADLKKYKVYVHREMRFAELLPLFRSVSYSNYDELAYIILCPECEEWTWVKFNLSSGFLDFFGDLIITNVDVYDDCLRCWIKTEEFNYFGVGIARLEMQRGKPVESGTAEEGKT